MKKVKSITVIGRRWFNRGPGNTYHSCSILVNGAGVHRVDFAYGYDSAYVQSAVMWLHKNGYLPGMETHESLWRYCERHGITYNENVTDVQRKKDL